MQCRALEEAQLAHIMFPLQQLPELSAATDAATNKKVKEHVVTLMQSDTLQIIEGNGKFLRLCSQYLCDALWQAAVNHRLKHMGPVVDLYRYGNRQTQGLDKWLPSSALLLVTCLDR